MINSEQRMPQRLELFYSNLNRANMRRRLFYIYKWNVGRRNSNRKGYVQWLRDLVTWMEETSGVDLPEEIMLNGEKLDEDNEDDDFEDSEEDKEIIEGEPADEVKDGEKDEDKDETEEKEDEADKEEEDEADEEEDKEAEEAEEAEEEKPEDKEAEEEDADKEWSFKQDYKTPSQKQWCLTHRTK